MTGSSAHRSDPRYDDTPVAEALRNHRRARRRREARDLRAGFWESTFLFRMAWFALSAPFGVANFVIADLKGQCIANAAIGTVVLLVGIASIVALARGAHRRSSSARSTSDRLRGWLMVFSAVVLTLIFGAGSIAYAVVHWP